MVIKTNIHKQIQLLMKLCFVNVTVRLGAWAGYRAIIKKKPKNQLRFVCSSLGDFLTIKMKTRDLKWEFFGELTQQSKSIKRKK